MAMLLRAANKCQLCSKKKKLPVCVEKIIGLQVNHQKYVLVPF